MSSIDLGDLRGVFPTPLRWSATNGVLGYSVYDGLSGERTIEPIELGSEKAKFVLDFSTRERGYGMIRKGVYDMRLTPVGSPPPEWPNDPDFKPAVGMWMWNPPLGELRLETNGTTFRDAIGALWDRCRGFKEASEGLLPVIHFVDRIERPNPAVDSIFWAPVIDIIGWIPRDKIPCFAVRPPTVRPPLALDSQVRHALLAHLEQPPAPQKAVEPSPQNASESSPWEVPEPPPQEAAPSPSGAARSAQLRAKFSTIRSTESALKPQQAPEAPTRRPSRSSTPAPAVAALTTVKARLLEKLLASAAAERDHGGWSGAELYNVGQFYGSELAGLVEQGRLEKRGERYYAPGRKTPIEEFLDDEIPNDPVPEL
jgi:hypothetical protein